MSDQGRGTESVTKKYVFISLVFSMFLLIIFFPNVVFVLLIEIYFVFCWFSMDYLMISDLTQFSIFYFF
jgi:hypothetical protein